MALDFKVNINELPLEALIIVAASKRKVKITVSDETCLLVNDNVKFTSNISTMRYLANTDDTHKWMGTNALERCEINHWITYSVGPLSSKNNFQEALDYLDRVIAPVTYLVGNQYSLADIVVWSKLFKLPKWIDILQTNSSPTNVTRWYTFIASLDFVKEALTQVASLTNNFPGKLEKKEIKSSSAIPESNRKDEGKFVDLPGAEMGKVVVRFPPEASGYLHIGHAKAALLNQYYKEAFNGQLIMRFDDTNPAKEKEDFEKVILEDLKLLKVDYDRYSHTSDYFDLMLEMCEKLIKEKKAYVDDTNAEDMKKEREQKICSKNRNNSVEKNLSMWNEMKNGTAKGQTCCVRAKIDMSSLNGCMRDPTIYRCKNETHPRTGNKYKVYPTYDFACPIVDSLEGVTHCLRTMEYHDRDEQFYWFIDVLGLRKPHIWEYSRLNMTNTVLSKRKLTWFVENRYVKGWDDPRMPTVRGVLRRGMTVEGLRQFIIAQGSSRSVVLMEWDKIWAFNKKVIDPVAPRYTVVDAFKKIPVQVLDVNESSVQVAKHPKNPEVGEKTIWTAPKLLVDEVDAVEFKENENVTFINWGNLTIKKIIKENGRIVEVVAAPNLEDKNYKKTMKITWLADTNKAPSIPVVCLYFDHIISKAILGKDEDFKKYIDHNTMFKAEMLGEPELASVKKSEIIQLQRKGFFICDQPYEKSSVHTLATSPLVLIYIPDGHSKGLPPGLVPVERKLIDHTYKNRSDLIKAFEEQKELVRKMRYEKKNSTEIDPEIQKLNSLSEQCQEMILGGWPSTSAQSQPISPPEDDKCQKAKDLLDKITSVGDEIRKLKAEKSDKAIIAEKVKLLLQLKSSFKEETGEEWKLGISIEKMFNKNTDSKEGGKSQKAQDLLDKIASLGDEIRKLKSEKADKALIGEKVKLLLQLKTSFKEETGEEWKPGISIDKTSNKNTDGTTASKAAKTSAEPSAESSALCLKISELSNVILKKSLGDNVPDAALEEQRKLFKKLCADFKSSTGFDWKPDFTRTNEMKFESSDNFVVVHKTIFELDKKLKSGKKLTNEEENTLKTMKENYKDTTGKEWTPEAAAPYVSKEKFPWCPPAVNTLTPVKETPAVISGDSDSQLLNKIKSQGDKIRQLKSQKAEKSVIDAEVKILLNLKNELKSLIGKDWTPAMNEIKSEDKSKTNTDSQLSDKIKSQGDKVRQLKSQKAEKSVIDAEVKILLNLKNEFKSSTGKDWTPAMSEIKSEDKNKTNTDSQLSDKIKSQGDKVRQLKSQKAEKSVIDAEVKILLNLKSEFKSLTGKDWTPETNLSSQKIKTDNESAPVKDKLNEEIVSLTEKIKNQGNIVRTMKSNNTDKEQLNEAIQKLLSLKEDYKSKTGQDFPSEGKPSDKKSKSGKSDTNKKNKSESNKKEQIKSKPMKSEQTENEGGLKKITRLGLEAKKEENLPEWYSQIIVKSELIEYYDISGCYILRPWSYAIWEAIKDFLDNKIKLMGVKNCYFPIFVSKAVLEKEKTHIADFAPEVAWVTKSGESDLAEPIAVRPTSETVMYPAYAKWIQSYRDLPIKLNQWNNVVRWEFKHPQPFLRTREFLWQEGHTAFATYEEAEAEVYTMLDYYAQVYTDLLAVPVVKGKKTEKEKFAGGDYTLTVEAYISASGRAIQGGTSHHLGQNFSKMFEIIFEDPVTQEKKFVYQNSWGLTTRTIGVLIMVHADNQGLVLPPRVASIQVVIVPCGITASLKKSDKDNLLEACSSTYKVLSKSNIRCELDDRENYSPGWKFNHWELKGVPIRMEIGPKDLEKNQVVVVRRDTGEKLTIPSDPASLTNEIQSLLDRIQSDLLMKATNELKQHMIVCKDWNIFCQELDNKNILLSPFCGKTECEDKIKEESARNDPDVDTNAPSMGAKSLCIPFDQPAKITSNDKCIHPNCRAKPNYYCLFGRSY